MGGGCPQWLLLKHLVLILSMHVYIDILVACCLQMPQAYSQPMASPMPATHWWWLCCWLGSQAEVPGSTPSSSTFWFFLKKRRCTFFSPGHEYAHRLCTLLSLILSCMFARQDVALMAVQISVSLKGPGWQHAVVPVHLQSRRQPCHDYANAAVCSRFLHHC